MSQPSSRLTRTEEPESSSSTTNTAICSSLCICMDTTANQDLEAHTATESLEAQCICSTGQTRSALLCSCLHCSSSLPTPPRTPMTRKADSEVPVLCWVWQACPSGGSSPIPQHSSFYRAPMSQQPISILQKGQSSRGPCPTSQCDSTLDAKLPAHSRLAQTTSCLPNTMTLHSKRLLPPLPLLMPKTSNKQAQT